MESLSSHYFDLHCGDCMEHFANTEHRYDLVFGSPPYESQRSYGIGYSITTEGWIQWMADLTQAALRRCSGLVAWVVQGPTKNYSWSASPARLIAELHKRGVVLRNPPIFHRVGIPGSGGPDWLRGDYEWIVCATNGGKLPWSDNTACGEPPKFSPGGAMTHQMKSGRRVADKGYNPPAKANPGSVIHCTVGGGRMGHPLAHENEAPFPLSLAEFFVKSFCPPGGIVCDPFCGSGTTGHAAILHGRNFVGIDIRESQIEISRKRLTTL